MKFLRVVLLSLSLFIGSSCFASSLPAISSESAEATKVIKVGQRVLYMPNPSEISTMNNRTGVVTKVSPEGDVELIMDSWNTGINCLISGPSIQTFDSPKKIEVSVKNIFVNRMKTGDLEFGDLVEFDDEVFRIIGIYGPNKIMLEDIYPTRGLRIAKGAPLIRSLSDGEGLDFYCKPNATEDAIPQPGSLLFKKNN